MGHNSVRIKHVAFSPVPKTARAAHRTARCDPEGSVDVLIEHNTFHTGDDGIAIKSGRDADGWRVAQVCDRGHNPWVSGLSFTLEMPAGHRRTRGWLGNCACR